MRYKNIIHMEFKLPHVFDASHTLQNKIWDSILYSASAPKETGVSREIGEYVFLAS